MANQVQTTSISTTAAGTPAITLADGDTLFVGPSATITTSGAGSNAIVAGAATKVTIDGTLYAAESNTIDSNSPFSAMELRISSSGSIFGNNTGVALDGGNNVIVNSGEISTLGIAIQLLGGSNTLTNYGSIFSSARCIDIESGNNSIYNYGDIRGTRGAADGIVISSFADGGNVIHNYGTISGQTANAILISGTAPGRDVEIYNAGVLERTNSFGSGNAIAIDGTGTVSLLNDGRIVGDVTLASGNDIVNTLRGTISGKVLAGNGDDSIIGSDIARDVLLGQHGDDVLEGNGGDDTLNGGAGADELYGGAGNDSASYANASSGVTVDLTSAGNNGGEATGDSYDSIEAVIGSSFGDQIYGSTAANRLQGGTGNDVLDGRSGNDYLHGGSGADTMTGGSGDDIFILDDGSDSVIEAAAGGSDRAMTSASFALGAGQEVERIVATGTAATNLTGNELDNVLVGNSAANVLDGGLGMDTMRGGTGNDVYRVNQADDAAIERAGEGTDTVESTITRTLGSFQENLVLTGLANINGTGNELANQLTGNDGNNLINGREGADTLTGGVGNDIFAFNAGMADGDAVADFAGNGGAVGDSLRFVGYGTAAQGATFVQLDATTWQINSADNSIHDSITLVGAPGVDASDFAFI